MVWVFFLCYFRVGIIRDFGILNLDGLKINFIVYSSGFVFFLQFMLIQSVCVLNIVDFFFDDQICQLMFGFWIMDFMLLRFDFNNGGIDLIYFIENNMWDLLDIFLQICRQMYLFYDNDLFVVVYILVLRRRFLFYVINYIVFFVVILFLLLLLFFILLEVGK